MRPLSAADRDDITAEAQALRAIDARPLKKVRFVLRALPTSFQFACSVEGGAARKLNSLSRSPVSHRCVVSRVAA